MAESATVLLFLSKGYFKSLNCLREVKAFTAAKREDQGLILVHETAPTHGGVTLEHLRQECPADLAPQIFSDTNLQKLIPFYRQVRDGWPCDPHPLGRTPPTPPHSTSPTHPLPPPQERVWAQSLQQIAAIMVMHTARAQQLAQTVGKSPRPTLSRRTSRQGSLASLTGKSRLQASSPLPPSPQSSPPKTTGRLLPRLSSLSSPSQSTEALTPTGPEASGASASQRQSRRSSGLASIHRLRQSLVRGPQIDQVLSELKLPQANRSLAARRTPAL